MTATKDNGKIVLVTGINGYIASVLGHQLLELGYTLRGTARSTNSTEALQHGAYKAFGSRFQPVAVPDMLAPGAFDEVVKGVHIIIHTASPVTFSKMPWKKYKSAAVGGAVGILRTALQHAGPQLETVVVTSSVAAIVDRSKGLTHLNTEHDWNQTTLADAEKNGDDSPPFVMYAASKIAAEKAVWEWASQGDCPFAVTCVNPAVVTGPPVQPPTSSEGLNETLKPLFNIFSGKATEIPPGIGSGAFVDVRDVARIHIWCAEHPKEAGGQRWIACAGQGLNQAAADILRKAYPDRANVIPKGEPGKGYQPDYMWADDDGPKVSGHKAQENIGFDYIGFEQAILDTAKVMEKYL